MLCPNFGNDFRADLYTAPVTRILRLVVAFSSFYIVEIRMHLDYGWLEEHEICVGLVMHMNYQMLYGDPDVDKSCKQEHIVGDVVKSRPMICVHVEQFKSLWTPTSTTKYSQKYRRLLLDRQWRSGGVRQWTSNEQYLLDGASLFWGSSRSFIRATHAERTTPSTRARLATDGVAAVHREIVRQRLRMACVPPFRGFALSPAC